MWGEREEEGKRRLQHKNPKEIIIKELEEVLGRIIIK